MKTPLSVFALILSLLPKTRQNEILELDMEFDNNMLVSLSSHIISNIPTQTSQIIEIPKPTQTSLIFDQVTIIPVPPITDNAQPKPDQNNLNLFTLIPLTTIVPNQPTAVNVINVTNTVIETVKVSETVKNYKNNNKSKRKGNSKNKHKKKNLKKSKSSKNNSKKDGKDSQKKHKNAKSTKKHGNNDKKTKNNNKSKDNGPENNHQRKPKYPMTNTENIKETTEVISMASAAATVKVNVLEKRDTDVDINDIWKFLENDIKPNKGAKQIEKDPLHVGKKTRMHHLKHNPKKNVKNSISGNDKKHLKDVKFDSKAENNELNDKTNFLEKRLQQLENLLFAQRFGDQKKNPVPHQDHLIGNRRTDEKEVSEQSLKSIKFNNKNLIEKVEEVDFELPKEPIHVYNQVKKSAQQDDKKFHTLPAKNNKDSCLIEQTVIVPAGKVSGPTLPPPAVSNIVQKIGPTVTSSTGKVVYNCITNYAGTATVIVPSMTIIPVTTTNLSTKTETVFARTTELLTEILYTPYTITTTSTDTMYMIKVTTVHGGNSGCKNCELDSNGMVLPAGQLPPGIFATPINEVDPNKFDIIGYAGMNPSNFNPELQGFQPQIPPNNNR